MIESGSWLFRSKPLGANIDYPFGKTSGKGRSVTLKAQTEGLPFPLIPRKIEIRLSREETVRAICRKAAADAALCRPRFGMREHADVFHDDDAFAR